jgi:hypothetical protein
MTATMKEPPTVPAPEITNKREHKYQTLHGLKYGVEIYESDAITDTVLKVICRFCLKNKVERPRIFKVPLKPDKYLTHNRGKKDQKGMHTDEWLCYERLEDDDAIVNYWKEQDETETTATAAVAVIVEKSETPSNGGRYRPAWKQGNENQVNVKYQPLHALKYGVKIHGRDLVTGQVSKVICRFCLKNKITHFPYPQIFDTSFRSDKYSNHNKTMHGPEWDSYQKLIDEDTIANYWKTITTEEEAIQVEATTMTEVDVAAGLEMDIEDAAMEISVASAGTGEEATSGCGTEATVASTNVDTETCTTDTLLRHSSASIANEAELDIVVGALMALRDGPTTAGLRDGTTTDVAVRRAVVNHPASGESGAICPSAGHLRSNREPQYSATDYPRKKLEWSVKKVKKPYCVKEAVKVNHRMDRSAGPRRSSGDPRSSALTR